MSATRQERRHDRRYIRPRVCWTGLPAIRLELDSSAYRRGHHVCDGGGGFPLGVMRVMRRALDLDTLFPIRDRASAHLMLLKARCLLAADVIGEREMVEVLRGAKAICGRRGTPPARRGTPVSGGAATFNRASALSLSRQGTSGSTLPQWF